MKRRLVHLAAHVRAITDAHAVPVAAAIVGWIMAGAAVVRVCESAAQGSTLATLSAAPVVVYAAQAVVAAGFFVAARRFLN